MVTSCGNFTANLSVEIYIWFWHLIFFRVFFLQLTADTLNEAWRTESVPIIYNTYSYIRSFLYEQRAHRECVRAWWVAQGTGGHVASDVVGEDRKRQGNADLRRPEWLRNFTTRWQYALGLHSHTHAPTLSRRNIYPKLTEGRTDRTPAQKVKQSLKVQQVREFELLSSTSPWATCPDQRHWHQPRNTHYFNEVCYTTRAPKTPGGKWDVGSPQSAWHQLQLHILPFL